MQLPGDLSPEEVTMGAAPATPVLQTVDEEMADATLADKLHQSLSPQEPPAPLPVVATVSGLDPIAALQQHLES
eukprot:9379163-Prorocentrum_lima.AAC.1